MSTRALVISGGGSLGAWAVGALRWLIEEQHEQFNWVVGTSTGALIAPMAALGGIDVLRQVYTHANESAVLGSRLPWRGFLSNGIVGWIAGKDSIYTTAPLRRLIEQQITAERFDRLRSDEDPAIPEVWVCAVNIHSGEKEFFSPRDAEMTRDKFIDCMIASATIPILMSRTQIGDRPDSPWYIDGGIRDTVPLGKAIELGATEMRVIILEPWSLPTTQPVDKIYDVAERTLMLMMQEIVDSDFALGKLITRELAWRDRLRATLKADYGFSDAMVEQLFAKVSGCDDPMKNDEREFHSVLFHVLRPPKELGSMIEFKPKVMSALEQKGYEEASHGGNWVKIPQDLPQPVGEP